MKLFMKDAILKIEYINVTGQKMTIAMNGDFSIWFKHEYYNQDFEQMKDILKTGPRNSFKYVLFEEETDIVDNFMTLARNVAKKM